MILVIKLALLVKNRVCFPPQEMSARCTWFFMKNAISVGTCCGVYDCTFLPNYPNSLWPQVKQCPSRVIAAVWFQPHETLLIGFWTRLSTNFGVLKYSWLGFLALLMPSLPYELLPMAYKWPALVIKHEWSSPQATSTICVWNEQLFGVHSCLAIC